MASQNALIQYNHQKKGVLSDMKKHSIKFLALTMALYATATLNGCVTTSKAADSGSLSTSSDSQAEASESNKILSVEDQEKAEEERQDEIAKQYSIYEPYGMTYDKKKDRFLYNGQMVRYFKDQISEENTNAFFFDDGVVDVEPIRSVNGDLIGLKQSSDSDFKTRSKKQEEIKVEFETVDISGENAGFEGGDPEWRDDSLDDYVDFGISYDEANNNWKYNGKPIHILYDADHNTYCNNSIDDGISIRVIRDKHGNIVELKEADAKELKQYIK